MTQPPPPEQYTVQPTMSPTDEKMWATLTHVGGIFFYWLVPLIAYLVLKDRGPFVRWHTRQALNFHITLAIAYAAGFVLTFVIVGSLVLIAAGVVQIVFGIIAAVAANRGEFYRIPLAIEFVK
jgi:uncharacterized Tic20 family protein